MALSRSKFSYRSLQSTGLIAVILGCCIYTGTVRLFDLDGGNDNVSRLTGWPITGIVSAAISFLLRSDIFPDCKVSRTSLTDIFCDAVYGCQWKLVFCDDHGYAP
ncbi:uncharacterized protein RCC_04114 [Ramularia collo-cygni]|uniref:Uncharacterized protein n=1 Tax=Ramularia collo-cygni TaxID=112498 RepID=A0A2D3V9R7_9PEZI|nr:uncharacterized protein RCC_04114 [Ramularia collo-cygni]CZT18269.1 uncharacterized protein RCC_04114 [Ramularia collo-cygni]